MLVKPTLVADCQPCQIKLSPGSPPYDIFFDVKAGDDGRAVTGIRVRRNGSPGQTLPVRSMSLIGPGEQFFFGPEDINRDGNADLMLITDRGTANAYARYWVFQPKTGIFQAIGRFPILKQDSGTNRLVSYERGGYGGLVYQKNEYRFEGERLVLVRSEKQDQVNGTRTFRRITRERVNGRMKVTKGQTLSEAEASESARKGDQD